MKNIINFDEIAKEYTEKQISSFMQEKDWSRECTLLYLWFFNNISVDYREDVVKDMGRGMYRKYAEAIAYKLLQEQNNGKN